MYRNMYRNVFRNMYRNMYRNMHRNVYRNVNLEDRDRPSLNTHVHRYDGVLRADRYGAVLHSSGLFVHMQRPLGPLWWELLGRRRLCHRGWPPSSFLALPPNPLLGGNRYYHILLLLGATLYSGWQCTLTCSDG